MICPKCNSDSTKKYGKDRNGTQRYHCVVCHSTFLDAVERLFNRALSKNQWKLSLAAHLIRAGFSKRRAASVAGLSKQTVFTHLGHIQSVCPCGLPSGHRAWCEHRINQSARRKLYLTEGRAGDKSIPGIYTTRICPECNLPVEQALRHRGCWAGGDAINGATSLDSSDIENYAPINNTEQTMFSNPLDSAIDREAVRNVIQRLIDAGMDEKAAVALVSQHVDIGL